MAKRYWRNRALLVKPEATSGVDSVPTGAANAVLATNVSLEPLVGEDLSRDLVLPNMGHQGIILDGNYARISYEVEVAGSGVAGTAPGVGPCLRACGFQEIITANTKVEYKPVSKLFESATHYFNIDGVNHILLGTRGTVTFGLTPRQIPRFVFTMTGLIGTIADVALPAANVSKFIAPLPVGMANTTISLFGYAGACEGVTFDVANQIEPRLLINSESVEQTDRQMTGSAIMEATQLSDKNWFQLARSHTKGALAAQHGTVAGNIVKIDAPAVQIGRPTYGETQRIMNNTLPLMLTPTAAGNDEVLITFQ
ncbi:phage tail tube protein [Agrobacterium tumefaciens]|uniref:phage tail tube protein n=1 Tax=Agrobacterium tumefaciens TaxID=358 RepID=UPI0038506D82